MCLQTIYLYANVLHWFTLLSGNLSCGKRQPKEGLAAIVSLLTPFDHNVANWSGIETSWPQSSPRQNNLPRYRAGPGTARQQENRLRKSVIQYVFLWFNDCSFFLYLTNTSIYDHCFNNIKPVKHRSWVVRDLRLSDRSCHLNPASNFQTLVILVPIAPYDSHSRQCLGTNGPSVGTRMNFSHTALRSPCLKYHLWEKNSSYHDKFDKLVSFSLCAGSEGK